MFSLTANGAACIIPPSELSRPLPSGDIVLIIKSTLKKIGTAVVARTTDRTI